MFVKLSNTFTPLDIWKSLIKSSFSSFQFVVYLGQRDMIAIKIELEDRGFMVKQQFPIQVTYKNKAQVLNYLKETGIKLGILVNFSRERNTVDIERIPNLI